jgi:hypothetical protein
MWQALEGKENCTRFVVGKPERKRTLGRPRRRLKNVTKMYNEGIGWEGVEWIHLTQERERWRAVVNAVINPGFCCYGVS